MSRLPTAARVAASLALVGGAAGSLQAAAQTTSTVYSPAISEGYRGIQLGLGATDAGDGREDRTGARFIYDHALDSRRMFRMQVVGNDRGKEGFEYAYIQPSFYQELTPDSAKVWKSTLRLDFRLTEGQAPEQTSAHLANQFDFGGGWRARAHFIGTAQFGDAAADGLFLATRSSLSKSLGEGAYLGVDMFNNFGSTSALGSFKDQVHQAGPLFTARFSEHLTWNAGVLFGLSERAPDADFRFWIVRTFGD
jgi:hypothetical protein